MSCHLWRITLALLSGVGNVVLANKYQHDVFVFDRTPQGLVAAGPAAEELTPQQFDIQAQLGAWVRAYKDVPGDDKMVDRNIRLLEATTADVGNDHALSDLKTWQSHNNPKIECQDFTREVDPTVDAIPPRSYSQKKNVDASSRRAAPPRVLLSTMLVSPPNQRGTSATSHKGRR